jgi:hypothetical protein
MEREALKLALETLKWANKEINEWMDDAQGLEQEIMLAITAIKKALAQPAQPAQEPEMLTIVYQSGYHDGKQAALAGREWNFCERCGKRTADLTIIHTCTPPQEGT